MTQILNITNGGAAASVMKKAGVTGKILTWDDVLHDGPVPDFSSLTELSEIRTQFLVGRGWGTHSVIEQRFIERDNFLQSFRDYARVKLWFEHDLYDQLQLLQILGWFAHQELAGYPLSMICTEYYLGTLSPEELCNLERYEQSVTREQLRLGQKAWSAFCSETPLKWQQLLDEDTSDLPFLQGAVLRLLEEFPASCNGLSRTAQATLSILAEGELTAAELFSQYQQTEERLFMGDPSFWSLLQELQCGKTPLLYCSALNQENHSFNPEHSLMITPAGWRVLNNEISWITLKDPDRWIGGVYLRKDVYWTWDGERQIMLKK